jgi:hypothetical protein
MKVMPRSPDTPLAHPDTPLAHPDTPLASRTSESKPVTEEKKIFLSFCLVVIASASRTEDPGFESRQGVSFFRFLYIAVLLSKLNMHFHFGCLRKINVLKILKKNLRNFHTPITQ